MRILVKPVVGYVAAVLGVIVIASIAVFNLRGSMAKTQRHWDADIDRIITQIQDKRRDMDAAALAWSEIQEPESDAGPQIPSFPQSVEHVAVHEETAPQKAQNPGGKKYSRRADQRRQSDIATSLVTLPKLAVSAAGTTTTSLFGLR
jgi:hypothetical protein